MKVFHFLLSRNIMNSMIRAQLMVTNHRTWQVQTLMDFGARTLPLLAWISVHAKPSNFPVGAPSAHEMISQGWLCLKAHMLQHLSYSTHLPTSRVNIATSYCGHMSEFSNFLSALVFHVTTESKQTIEKMKISEEIIIILILVWLNDGDGGGREHSLSFEKQWSTL